MVTTRSQRSSTTNSKAINYNEDEADDEFEARLNHYDKSPKHKGSRKRKQNQMSHGSESDYHPTDEYHPPNKKRKVNKHSDSELSYGTRKSKRIAQKLSHTRNGYHSMHDMHDNEEMENEEKDVSHLHTPLNHTALPKRKSARLRKKTQLASAAHFADDQVWQGRLRRSNRKRDKSGVIGAHASDDENDLNKSKRKKIDSDYGDAEFEQECEEQDNVPLMADDEDDMNCADESDVVTDGSARRRSQRLSQKDVIHYYNNGTDIQIESKSNDVNDSMDIDPSRSNSLPLAQRRPVRNRKPPRNDYLVSQYKEFQAKESRRLSLRKKKVINYAESPASDEEESSDDGRTTMSTTRSPYRKRGRGRGRGRNRRNKRRKKRQYCYSSDSSESEDYSTDTLMDIREQKRIRRERKKIRPIQIHDLGLYHDAMAPNLQKKRKKEDKNADISPMEIDMDISWDNVGGLSGHVQKLKEMVILPLLYPSEFSQFKMSTPKGVLFHGPPGTGKTLVARILAAQCSTGVNPDGTAKKKVSFYMRKGADCLSKWVGEAERQLRLLFDEAHKNQPAVIFFDEIDGLAPVRSSRQDQIHSSIVSTLLALMDGLDGRGQIIVIGATNRPDAIDPALRRPGRFDRELCFNLPGKNARKDILKIHTRSWEDTNCKIDEDLMNYLSEQSVGYCGADLEALCREAFLAAVRRTYPQIYHSNVRLQIDTQRLEVIRDDFEKALKDITPSSQRSSLVYARALPELLGPLLGGQLESIKRDIEAIFSLKKAEEQDMVAVRDSNNNSRNTNSHSQGSVARNMQHYRYLIHGSDRFQGQNYLGRGVLHLLEEYPMYSLDLASIYGDSTTKCADESILRLFKEALRNTPSVIYWPNIDRWWDSAHQILKTSIALLINDISNDTPILLIATSNIGMQDLENELFELFEKFAFHNCEQNIETISRKKYWNQLRTYINEKPKRNRHKTIESYPHLPIAALPKDSNRNNKNTNESSQAKTDKTESERLIETERMCCVNLRVYIRSVCNRLCKHFKNFIDQMADDGVCNNNLSLFEIRQRNNERKIPTVIAFLTDIDKLVENVKNSAQTESLKARQFINEACHLQDQALSMMSQVNRDLVKQCDKLANANKHVSFAENDEILTHSNSNSNSNHSNRNSNKSSDKSERDDCEDCDMGEDETNVLIEDMPIINNGSVTMESKDDCESDESEREIEVNMHKLNGIIDRLTKVTLNYSIEEMEEKMYNLLRIVYSHSNEWNKNKLINELAHHIKTYFKPKQQR